MKQLIVLMAVLPLMLVFIMQYAFEQHNSSNVNKLQNCIYTAKEQAKQDGYFKDETIQALKAEIAETFGIEETEVLFEGTTVPKYRVNQFDERELIYYKIGVPISKLMAGTKLFGIKAGDNQMIYTIENYTASERLSD